MWSQTPCSFRKAKPPTVCDCCGKVCHTGRLLLQNIKIASTACSELIAAERTVKRFITIMQSLSTAGKRSQKRMRVPCSLRRQFLTCDVFLPHCRQAPRLICLTTHSYDSRSADHKCIHFLLQRGNKKDAFIMITTTEHPNNLGCRALPGVELRS